MISVNALIPAITIHHQVEGASSTGFRVKLAALRYSIRGRYFARNHAETFPMTGQRVVSWGHVACIAAIQVYCCHRWAINFFIISTTSLSQMFLYARFRTRSNWCNPHQTRYTLWFVWVTKGSQKVSPFLNSRSRFPTISHLRPTFSTFNACLKGQWTKRMNTNTFLYISN